jgi:sugar/nucleoside kinase (ribokinase family)
MSKTNNNYFLLLGNLAIDITSYTDLYSFSLNKEDHSAEITTTVGGCIFNIAVGLRVNNIPCSIFSLYANDQLGQLLINDLKSKDIDTKNMAPLLPKNNQTVLLVKKDGNKIMFSDRAKLPEINKIIDHYFENEIKNIRNIHLSPNFWNKIIIHKLCKKNSDLLISADLHLHYGIDSIDDDLLPYLEILFFSGAGRTNSKELVRRAMKQGAKIVICTLGDKGAILGIKETEKYYHFPAIKQDKEIVNTIGAGDIFAATFLSFYYQGNDIREAMLKAHIQAGKRCISKEFNLYNKQTLDEQYNKISKNYFDIVTNLS